MSPAVATLPSVPSPAPEHRLVCGPFPALEPEFLAAVRALKRDDPLRPIQVLVGSNLLAVYLRRRAAGEFGAVANLRFLTFLDLAREIAPEEDPRPSLPPLGETLLARRALLETAEGAAFGELRSRPSLAAAIVSTAADLRDAGIPPDELPALVLGASDLPDRRRHLGALAAVLSALERKRGRFADATALIERSAVARVGGSEAPLLVYGLYDLGGVRGSLLRNVAGARPLHVFVPEDGDAEPPGLASVRTSLFRDLLGVEAESLPPPPLPAPAVTVAPSENDEAREVVREILRAADRGVPLHRMAILLRNPETQEPALVAELNLRKIPFFRPAGAGFARSPLGRAARLLLALAARDFPVDALRELLDLLETLGRYPSLGLAGVTPARIGNAIASLGVREGLPALEKALDEARGRLSRPLAAADDPDGRFEARRSREREELDLLAGALSAIRPALIAADPVGWSEWAERMARSFAALLAPVPGSDRLDRAVEAVRALEIVEPGAVLEGAALEALLPDALDLSAEIRGRFERNGVSLLSAVSARGLLFDVVLVPGLVEQSFPRPSRPDPLLFDAERRRIAEASRKPLVPRTGDRHGREERFLFSIARSSALKSLVLFASAKEIATDRPRLLSPFLLDALPEGARRAILGRELGRSDEALPPEVVWLPAGRLKADGIPLDPDEALRRALAANPALQSAIPAAVASVSRAFERGRARARDVFTEYEGNVGRAAARLGLRGKSVSASRLERFSQCPYRSFLERGLGLEAGPDGGEEIYFALDPLERGNALHAAMRDLTRRLVKERRLFQDLDEREQVEFASRASQKSVDEILAARRSAPPPILVEIETERLRRLLLGLVRHLSDASAGLPAAGAEVRFGPATSDPADRDEDLSLSVDTPIPIPGLPFETGLLGRIDRLDREGDRAAVVDYKTGRPAPFGKTNRNGRLVAGGERLQLPVYALAAQHLGARSVTSEYLFVEESAGEEGCVTAISFDEAKTGSAAKALGEVVRLVEEAVARGLFLPRTTSLCWGAHCRFCDFAAVCGPGHERIFERKWAHEARSDGSNPLLRLREIP